MCEIEECPICDSENLIQEENGFRCSVCSTVIESKVKSRKSKKRKKKKSSKHAIITPTECNDSTQPSKDLKNSCEFDFGVKWTTYEAFNIIIKKQVDALVSFGANKELHGVVLQLWAQYLHLNNVAFPDTSETPGASSAILIRNRDYHVKHSESEVIPIRRGAVFSRKKRKKQTAVEEELTEFQTPPRKRKGKKDDNICNDNADMPLLLSQINDIKKSLSALRDSDSEVEHERVALKKKLRKMRHLYKKPENSFHRKTGKEVDYMCMFKTIAFCYLGILILKEPILLGDIKRWIREGHIPYIGAANLLPATMKLQGIDFLTFQQTHPPSSDEVRYAAGRLAYFLGIQELDKPSLEYIVARFLVDLNLPAELNTFVRNLMDVKPVPMEWVGWRSRRNKLDELDTDNQTLSIPNYEAYAVGYIAIALKLLFGLDDHTEKEISSYAQKLSMLKGIEKSVFIWDEWVQHINMKFDFAKAFLSPSLPKEYLHATVDVQNLHHFFRVTMLKRYVSSDIVKAKSHEVYRSQCASIWQLFANLNGTGETSTSSECQLTNFPLMQVESQFLSKFNTENSFLNENFRGRTVSYLTDSFLWHRFARKQCGVSKKELQLATSEFENFTRVNNGYWFHNAKIDRLTYLTLLPRLPGSFQWLLLVLGHCTEIKLTEIYAKVLLIEKILTFKTKQRKAKQKRKRRTTNHENQNEII